MSAMIDSPVLRTNRHRRQPSGFLPTHDGAGFDGASYDAARYDDATYDSPAQDASDNGLSIRESPLYGSDPLSESPAHMSPAYRGSAHGVPARSHSDQGSDLIGPGATTSGTGAPAWADDGRRDEAWDEEDASPVPAAVAPVHAPAAPLPVRGPRRAALPRDGAAVPPRRTVAPFPAIRAGGGRHRLPAAVRRRPGPVAAGLMVAATTLAAGALRPPTHPPTGHATNASAPLHRTDGAGTASTPVRPRPGG